MDAHGRARLGRFSAVQRAGSTRLRGQQQQMIAIRPRDDAEPARSPLASASRTIVVRNIYAQILAIVNEGTSIVIVEQHVVQVLKAISHVYCLQEGRGGRPPARAARP
jgi:ABC-type branched-subunit amino acid transport system ATPase component